MRFVEEYGDIQDWRNLVGTGPFMFTDWVDGSSMTWEKNPDYWGTDEKFPENQIPYADVTRVLVMKDEATRIAAMRTAKGDYMGWLANSAISTTEQAEALLKTNPDITLIPYAYRSTTSTAFNVDKAPFDDINVRRAMQMALDLDTINTIYFKGWATVEPMGQVGTGAIEYVTHSPIGLKTSSNTTCTTPKGPSPCSTRPVLPPMRTASESRDRRYSTPPPTWRSRTSSRTTGRTSAWTSRSSRGRTTPQSVLGSANTLTRTTWSDRLSWATTGGPITVLRSFIHSEGGYNYTGVRNPEFDAMIEAAEAAPTTKNGSASSKSSIWSSPGSTCTFGG